jgi:hypothetical protein
MRSLLLRISYTLLLFCGLSSVSLAAFACPSPAPLTISSAISDEPQIGVDTDGNAVAIWRQFDGGFTNIQTAYRLKNDSWSSPVTIATVTGNHTNSKPQIAVNASGYAVAVWANYLFGFTTIEGATLPSIGATWSPTSTLSNPIGSEADMVPHLAVNDSGYAVAIWQSPDGGVKPIQAATLGYGSSFWSSPVSISTATINDGPQIAVDSTGNAVAVWRNVDITSIQAATLPFGGAWSSPTTLSGAASSTPQVAMNASGYIVTTWQTVISGTLSIQSATRQFAGSWTAAVTLSSGSSANQSAVDVDPAGNAIATWSQSSAIQSSLLPFGGSWTAPVTVSTTASGNSKVATDANGNAYVVWNAFSGIIQASELPFGGIWSTPCSLTTANSNILPALAMNASGYAVVDWVNGSSSAIQATDLVPIPTVTNVSPNFGPTIGGTYVLITGTDFINVSAVDFDSTPATSYIVISPTTIVAFAPVGSAGIVNITVTTLSGRSLTNINDQYTYVAIPPPYVNFVFPNSGSTAGGNSVTITGTNFVNVSSVAFGAINAPSFTVNSMSSITAIAPPGSSGTVNITVTTETGTSPITVNDRYTYAIPFPTVTNLSSRSGPTIGGSIVTISGANFINVTRVTFGSINAPSFTVNSPTSITAISPAEPSGTVNVTVTTQRGTSVPGNGNDRYTFLAVAPLPPGAFTGTIMRNKFFNKTECILNATWTASPSINVVGYRIYKDGMIVATFSDSSDFAYEAFVKNCSGAGYEIASVSSDNVESTHLQLRITNG